MPTTPTPITALPTVPTYSDDAPTFDAQFEAFNLALKNAFVSEANSLASNVYANATEAATSASNAALAETAAEAAQLAAETAANATKWVSGTTYAQGDVTWSPADYQSYRRKTAGAGTIDPSADSTNWERLRAGSGLILLASYDAAGAATVDIEALSSSYDNYVISFDNLAPSSTSGPLVRVKKSGAYVTGSTYNVLATRNDGSSWNQSISIGTSSASIGSVFGATWAGQIHVTRANSTTGQNVRAEYSGLSASAGNVGTTATTETTAATIQGVRLYVSSGTFTTGTIRLFGVSK